MKVVKKINNNVAECLDRQGNSLIAFGKGIGFPKTPYELDDLSKIDMTFYQLDDHFAQLIREIPEDILTLAGQIVLTAQKELSGKLNQNLVFSLADHIQFAMRRLDEFQEMRLLFSAEVANLYPKETAVARWALTYINQNLDINLPEGEVTSLAMHFINSQSQLTISQEEALIESLIDDITQIIEDDLQLAIRRDEFNYQRFQAHMRYYLKRIRQNEQFIDDNGKMLMTLKQSKGDIYQLAGKINHYIQQQLAIEPAQEEQLYLMIHINRLYQQNKEN